MIPHILSGDLLLKMDNLEKRFLAAILNTEEDSYNQEHQTKQERSSAHLRPFHWYNYLQKERPSEFSALNELQQKLQTGNYALQIVSLIHCNIMKLD